MVFLPGQRFGAHPVSLCPQTHLSWHHRFVSPGVNARKINDCIFTNKKKRYPLQRARFSQYQDTFQPIPGHVSAITRTSFSQYQDKFQPIPGQVSANTRTSFSQYQDTFQPIPGHVSAITRPHQLHQERIRTGG